ncbi:MULTISPECIES: hypothetical protein [Nonomuraea]|uniref:Lipoprotein LprG n=1 Tax=Nonomuraea ferruginea TaxID=46174 RepID=A0ABT4T3U9_9ACTN|nr:hypothetical protein [Nonomuraea ferruginea]MDA0644203.1 hypothetical protein [Nonomuraea ferruginea]
MTRFLVALAAVLTLTACAPPSPDVAALDHEFARRSTVRVDVELTVRADDAPAGHTFRQRGVLKLSPSGADGADLVLESSHDGPRSLHSIQTGGHVYYDRPPWSRMPLVVDEVTCDVPSYIGCLVDVLRPGVAEALLAASVSTAPDGAGTVRHSGVITGDRLHQAAGKRLLSLPMSVVPAALSGDAEHSWSMWIGADGLPRRVQASGPMSSVVPEPVSGLFMTVDIRFHDWGGSRTISAPADYIDVG